jgi:hypothetical protein
LVLLRNIASPFSPDPGDAGKPYSKLHKRLTVPPLSRPEKLKTKIEDETMKRETMGYIDNIKYKYRIFEKIIFDWPLIQFLLDPPTIGECANPKEKYITLGKFLAIEIAAASLVYFLVVAIIICIKGIVSGHLSLDWAIKILKCFNIFSLIFSRSELYEIVHDPFDLLALHLFIGHYYVAYIIYLDLKVRYCFLKNTFKIENLSPFLLSFGCVLFIYGIYRCYPLFKFDIDHGFDRSDWDIVYYALAFGAFNILSIALQLIAYRNFNRDFLRRAVVISFLLNVFGLALIVNLAMIELLFRSHIS